MKAWILPVWLIASLGLAQDEQAPQTRVDDGWVRFDESFFRLAAETGGDFYFWAPGELGRSDAMLNLDRARLLLAYGEMDSSTKRFEVPVDGSVKRVRFQAGIQGPAEIELRDPDGVAPVTGETVKVEHTRHMLLATVQSPRAGTWELLLHGEGRYAVTVSAATSIDIVDVDVGGSDAGDPVGPSSGRATLTGLYETVELQLRDEEGERLETLRFRPGEAQTYDGEVPIPARPFRFSIEGTDPQGHRFQRFEGRLRRGRTVSVACRRGRSITVDPGESLRIPFDVSNHAPYPQTFRFVATDAAARVLPVVPDTLTLEGGQTGEVAVRVEMLGLDLPEGGAGEVKPGAPPATPEGDVVLVVSSGEDEANSNAAVVELRIRRR